MNGPKTPAWISDANGASLSKVHVRLGEEEEPTEGDVRGTLNALVDYKEVAIRNAATDATQLTMPEEGFKYIREHLPSEAPERKVLDAIVNSSRQHLIDEAAQEVLNSLFSRLIALPSQKAGTQTPLVRVPLVRARLPREYLCGAGFFRTSSRLHGRKRQSSFNLTTA